MDNDFSFNYKDFTLMSKEQLTEVITTLGTIIRDHPDADGILQRVVDLVSKLTFSSGAAVEMLNDDQMVYVGVTENISEQKGLTISTEDSLSGDCATQGITLVCNDSETDERVDREACRTVGLRSMIVTPLKSETETVGVIKVFSPQPNAFDDVDVQILNSCAKIISFSLTNKHWGN